MSYRNQSRQIKRNELFRRKNAAVGGVPLIFFYKANNDWIKNGLCSKMRKQYIEHYKINPGTSYKNTRILNSWAQLCKIVHTTSKVWYNLPKGGK